MTLKQELQDLEHMSDRQRRGKCFELFLAHLLAEDGFKVNVDPKTAIPHQTDLSAGRDQLYFLVEAKWQKKAVNLPHISAVRGRLRMTSPDIFACVFSMSGFSKGAIEETSRDRSREILLFDEEEVRGMTAGDLSFDELLGSKREAFRTHASAWFQIWVPQDHSKNHLRSQCDVIYLNGARNPWMLSHTGNTDVLFSNEGLDISGRYSGAVFSLDFRLDIKNVDEFQRILDQARKNLGVLYDGSFAIHQRNVGWFGFGVENFLNTIASHESRYSELAWESYHHSEEIAYIDRLETGGLICFSSRQSTRGGGLHSSRGEILLPGIPVEMHGIQRFCKYIKQRGATFEIVSENPTKMIRFNSQVKIKPIAPIISTSDNREFLSGLVVRNPFLNQIVPLDQSSSGDDLFRLLLKYEFLFCALRHWHPPQSFKNTTYQIVLVEGCWIEHVPAFYILCDEEFHRSSM